VVNSIDDLRVVSTTLGRNRLTGFVPLGADHLFAESSVTAASPPGPTADLMGPPKTVTLGFVGNLCWPCLPVRELGPSTSPSFPYRQGTLAFYLTCRANFRKDRGLGALFDEEKAAWLAQLRPDEGCPEGLAGAEPVHARHRLADW
jgi:hypothetical protein